MNPERRPLLMDAEVQGKSARPRPDLRNSPESVLVDVKSGDEGNVLTYSIFNSMHFQYVILNKI